MAGELRHLLGKSGYLAEHARVRLIRPLTSEGHAFPAGKEGTVVSIYEHGQAYAVEFLDVDGEMAVLTIAADDLAQVARER